MPLEASHNNCLYWRKKKKRNRKEWCKAVISYSIKQCWLLKCLSAYVSPGKEKQTNLDELKVVNLCMSWDTDCMHFNSSDLERCIFILQTEKLKRVKNKNQDKAKNKIQVSKLTTLLQFLTMEEVPLSLTFAHDYSVISSGLQMGARQTYSHKTSVSGLGTETLKFLRC